MIDGSELLLVGSPPRLVTLTCLVAIEAEAASIEASPMAATTTTSEIACWLRPIFIAIVGPLDRSLAASTSDDLSPCPDQVEAAIN